MLKTIFKRCPINKPFSEIHKTLVLAPFNCQINRTNIIPLHVGKFEYTAGGSGIIDGILYNKVNDGFYPEDYQIGCFDTYKISVDIRTPIQGYVEWNPAIKNEDELIAGTVLYKVYDTDPMIQRHINKRQLDLIVNEWLNIADNPIYSKENCEIAYNYATYLLNHGIKGSIKIFDIFAKYMNNTSDPLYSDFWFNFGTSYRENGMTELSFQAFERALSGNSKNSIELLIIKGIISYHKNNHYDALQSFENILKINKNNYIAHYYIAVLRTTHNDLRVSQIRININWLTAISNCDNQLIRERIMGQYEDWIRYVDTSVIINVGKCYMPWITTTMSYHGLCATDIEIQKFDISAYMDSIFKTTQQINNCEFVKNLIKNSPPKSIVLFTGAGLSKEKGFPTRKDLWNCFDKDKAVSASGFMENPKYLWSIVRQFYEKASHQGTSTSNPYDMLNKLYENDMIQMCITQNVEGLHRQPVVELHGSLNRLICPKCFEIFDEPAKNHIYDEMSIPTCSQGIILKPDVVLFGEKVKSQDLDAAKKAINASSIMLILGTAADVAPATDLIRYAHSKGVKLIEINEKETRISRFVDHMLKMPINVALSQIL